MHLFQLRKLPAFLMADSSSTYSRAANQLGLGISTTYEIVRDVPRALCVTHRDELTLPTTVSEISRIMKGFQNISGLPFCVGAVDDSHIPWRACPKHLYYEYRCYNGYKSIVLFALSSSDRRIIYADVGQPGVLGDSMNFEQSKLYELLQACGWSGASVPSL